MTGQRPTDTQCRTPHRTSPRRILRGTTLGALTALLTATLQLTVGLLTAPPANADPTTSAWAQLRNCESGDNYTIVSVNHHYGAYQFSLATWHSIGGTGQPNQATPAEQNYRALYLYRMRGWQPWSCAHSLALPRDPDAASKTKPTYAQSAYMSVRNTATTTPTTTTTTTTIPAWPGKTYAYGDCATALRTWQRRMNTYGYTFQGTGCYYAKTKTAVLAVQRANHLTNDGLIGPQTWRAAWQGTAPQH